MEGKEALASDLWPDEQLQDKLLSVLMDKNLHSLAMHQFRKDCYV